MHTKLLNLGFTLIKGEYVQQEYGIVVVYDKVTQTLSYVDEGGKLCNTTLEEIRNWVVQQASQEMI